MTLPSHAVSIPGMMDAAGPRPTVSRIGPTAACRRQELVGSVTAILVAADPGSRTRHLPRFELFLEAARGPDLLPGALTCCQSLPRSVRRSSKGSWLASSTNDEATRQRLHADTPMLGGLLFDRLVFDDHEWRPAPTVRALLIAMHTGENS